MIHKVYLKLKRCKLSTVSLNLFGLSAMRPTPLLFLTNQKPGSPRPVSLLDVGDVTQIIRVETHWRIKCFYFSQAISRLPGYIPTPSICFEGDKENLKPS